MRKNPAGLKSKNPAGVDRPGFSAETFLATERISNPLSNYGIADPFSIEIFSTMHAVQDR